MGYSISKTKITGIVVLALVLLLGTFVAPVAAEEGERTLAILHVNDVHGVLENFDKISWYKQKLEEDYDDVLMVSAGDIFTGNPIVDEYVINGENFRGEPMVEVMNSAGMDLSVIGNHEFDYGQERLQANMENADFQFILANIKVNEAEADMDQPHAYVKLKTDFGATLAFLGLVEIREKYPATLHTNLYGLEFLEPIETAKKYTHLKDESDAFIGLTHLGYEWDRELSKKVGTFDLIIGGNSATAVADPGLTNDVLIAQAGEDLEFLGQVLLKFNEENEVVDRSGKLVEIGKIDGSTPKVKGVIESYKADLEEIFSRKINHLDKPIGGSENLGCLMTDAIVRSPELEEMGYKVDIAFQNSGGIRVGALEEGDVTVGDVFDLEPFGNDIIIYEMTTDDIRSLIRNDFDDHGPTDLKVAGMLYEVQINPDNEVEDVKLYNYMGEELSEEETYQVAMNEYMASSYEFTARNDGENTQLRVNDAIVTYLDQVIGEFELNNTYKNLSRASKAFVGEGEAVAKTEIKLTSKGKTDGSTPAGNLMADAIKAKTGVDVATFPSYSGLNANADSIRAEMGVTKAQLLTLYGSYIDENKAVVGEISGKNLEEFLLERAQAYDNVDLQVAGVEITYKTEDGKITDIETDLNPGETYTVSFNSYAFGSDYAPLEGFTKDHTTELTEKEMLLDYVEELEVIGKEVAEERVSLE
ncbi:MAG: 5'-nucleotidase C-terminal domain-containing protein [Candidatus Bipolaricaulota bacterium]